MKTLLRTFTGLALIAAANLALWAWANQPQQPGAAWEGRITGLAFSPMQAHQRPGGSRVTASQLESDLKLFAGKVTAVRTYGLRDGLDRIPEIADRHDLNVTLGAWIGSDPSQNAEEVRNLIRIGQEHKNVVRLLVGNEALLRGEISARELIKYIRQVKKKTDRRVSTAETWRTWMDHPELVNEVDFMTVHILPYWEGVPVDEAVDYVFRRYAQLQKTYPGKPIILGEVGWPSGGVSIGLAKPSRLNQAKFMRTFLNRVAQTDIVYYIVEAFDQPWKAEYEGAVGAYWGLYSVDRLPKFPMRGTVEAMPSWPQWAAAAGLLALIPAVYFSFGRRRAGFRASVLFALVTNLAASVVAWTAALGAMQYHTPSSALTWTALLLMQAFALLVLLTETIELSEVLWRGSSARDFKPFPPDPGRRYPRVSIHLPIHNEPPELVSETLLALSRQRYPDFEVLVIDNNTRDAALWKPVRDLCLKLGPRFRFHHLENWPGYKAGALNYALERTAPDAEVVAVIDSDYIVDPDWLTGLTPYFDDPKVAFVQAPQDYRDRDENLFKKLSYWEYAGFFHIGMVQRNDYNAIIQHGTMTLIRQDALIRAGRWAEWCICEDAELGLRLLGQGHESIYVPHSLGRGLMPDTFSAYKSQRFRWAYGAAMIMKRHLRLLFSSRHGSLTPAQKYHFVAGWLPWLCDGVSLLFVLASLGLTAHVYWSVPYTEFPVAVFLFPTIGIFCFKIMRSMWLYAARVKCTFREAFGAAVAGLALAHTVGKAVLTAFTTSKRPFLRTPKLEPGRRFASAIAMAFEEGVLLLMLWGGAALVSSLEQFDKAGGELWVSVLLVQSMPYLASVVMAGFSVLPKRREKVSVAVLQPELRPEGI